MTKLTGRVGRPSPAMVLAIVALIAAIGGGAYAAKKAKKITTKRLANKAVTTKKLTKVERSEGFFSRRAANLALPANVGTIVATLTLPAGSFQVTAGTALGASSAGVNPIRCQLRDDGVTLTAGDAYTESAVFSDTVTLTAFSDGGLVSLSCDPSLSSTARDRTIAATRVARVEVQ